MKNKKLIWLLAISIPVILSLAGCKKYENGPALSLMSKTKRVSNTWKVEKYIEDNVIKTVEFMNKKANYTETFTEDGIWSYYFVESDGDIKSGAGQWEFDHNGNNEIIDRNAGNSTWEEVHILRLKSNEFWFWYMDSGERKEYHMIPN